MKQWLSKYLNRIIIIVILTAVALVAAQNFKITQNQEQIQYQFQHQSQIQTQQQTATATNNTFIFGREVYKDMVHKRDHWEYDQWAVCYRRNWTGWCHTTGVRPYIMSKYDKLPLPHLTNRYQIGDVLYIEYYIHKDMQDLKYCPKKNPDCDILFDEEAVRKDSYYTN